MRNELHGVCVYETLDLCDYMYRNKVRKNILAQRIAVNVTVLLTFDSFEMTLFYTPDHSNEQHY